MKIYSTKKPLEIKCIISSKVFIIITCYIFTNLLLYRLINTIKPIVITTWSSPVMSIFFNTHLASCSSWLSISDFKHFMCGNSDKYLMDLLDNSAILRVSTSTFLSSQSELHLLPYLDSWYIVIPLKDSENIKYDLIQGVLKLDLLFMCQAVV